MKKTSLIFAALFSASFAMAQNTATTTQTGDNNEATTTQSGVDNLSTTEQLGNNNKGFTSQTGDRNSAEIIQGKASPLGDNFASITQQGGNDNVAGITQQNLKGQASILQDGSSNKALLTQNGPNEAGTSVSNAGIQQIGNRNILGGARTDNADPRLSNRATMLSDFKQDPVNTLRVLQEGDDNKAGVNVFNMIDIEIDQIGNNNSAGVYSQNTKNSDRSFAGIYQEGHNNTGRIIRIHPMNPIFQH